MKTGSKRENRVTGLLVPALAGALVLGCGDGSDKDWDEEIVLQLFKPANLVLGTVTVSVTQGSTTRTKQVNTGGAEGFFASCESNRMRVIPAAVSGKYPTVSVVITADNQLPKSGIKKDIPVPVSAEGSVVKMILLQGQSYQPAGACASDLDKIPPPKQVGEACAADAECLGGRCLAKEEDFQKVYTFQGGYCSASCQDTCVVGKGKCLRSGKDCTSDDVCRQARCDKGQYCFATKDGNNQVTDAFCVKSCSKPSDCRANDYECTPGGVCFPI